MQIPLHVVAKNISLSEAAEATIREKAAKLEEFYNRITSCCVTVEAPHKHHHKGIIYNVRIDITVPGEEILINRQGNEDLYVAIRDSFDAARRRLEDYARKQRGQVKTHETQPHGMVIKLFPEGGYGFLLGQGNYEIYFHRNAVLDNAFDRLKVGTKVRYVEEMGENGPQASTVAIMD